MLEQSLGSGRGRPRGCRVTRPGEEARGEAGPGEERREQWPGHSAAVCGFVSARAPRGLGGAMLRPTHKWGALPEKAREGAML